jgi:hypothetical protein
MVSIDYRYLFLLALTGTLLTAGGPGLAQEPEERFQVREQSASRKQAVALSVAFPGLGHLATGHRGKGTALVAGEILGLVIWLTAHADYKTQSEQVDVEKIHYASIRETGTYEEAEESWQRLNKLRDDADGSHLRRRIFGVVAIGVYGYNLVDALFLGGVEPAGGGRVGLVPTATPEQAGLALVTRF